MRIPSYFFTFFSTSARWYKHSVNQKIAYLLLPFVGITVGFLSSCTRNLSKQVPSPAVPSPTSTIYAV
ncbi:hypothetical protein CEN41_16245 [Fischerella thermalis CCMEE 5330]|uniref:Uncharacterized protein n=1 Tax=Fischerella thermalis CCMEE 5330 TaxID=2019670 RepID=A0A2N6M5B8_9CYAN|nr:hypothetical protein CEN41_16245 [Fischerella thermalis CCMEE 5330]